MPRLITGAEWNLIKFGKKSITESALSINIQPKNPSACFRSSFMPSTMGSDNFLEIQRISNPKTQAIK